MWYLIVPPIIVISSTTFLLWYLSRKGADPTVARRVSEVEDSIEAPAFSRTKSFLLRLLEKLAQRFKVGSLQAHNAMNELSQFLREKRRQAQEQISTKREMTGEKVLLGQVTDEEKESPLARFMKKTGALPAPATMREERQGMAVPPLGMSDKSISFREDLSAPILRKRKETLSRPMVSEVAMHPEGQEKKVVQYSALEERLIARIAVNPKDFTAYEELGDYYLEMKSITDAKECYRQVLKLSPVHRMVKIKIRRLEKLLTRSGE